MSGKERWIPQRFPEKKQLSPEIWRPTNVDLITISGHPGTGKTVTGQILAEVLGMEYIKIGDLFREYVRESTGKEVIGYTPRSEDIDEMLDNKQRILMEGARAEGRKIILEGRLAGVIATEEQIKAREGHYPISRIQRILFTADRDERIRRVLKRNPNLPIDAALSLTTEREQQDLITWRKFHPTIEGITDIYDPELTNTSGMPRFADIVVDTSVRSKEEVAKYILDKLAENNYIEQESR